MLKYETNKKLFLNWKPNKKCLASVKQVSVCLCQKHVQHSNILNKESVGASQGGRERVLYLIRVCLN